MNKLILEDIEREILTYYAQGYTSKRIANFPGLNRYKLKKCMENIYKKFGTNNKIIIIIEAFQKKLISI